MTSSLRPDGLEIVVPLHVEQLSLQCRQVGKGRSVACSNDRSRAPDPEQIEVDRVAMGRPLEAVSPVRGEGDAVVIPVVEEVVVIERRLILKEEIPLRRVQTTERHRESVVLREQDVVIERTEPGGRAQGQLPGTLDRPPSERRLGSAGG
jgi:Domain of unknown function (DUF2382)